jgi:spore germination cell wall hydrolase CwlJ-like protein
MKCDNRLTKGNKMIALACLATAIFFEARDQPVMGQFAVAEVVLVRADHERFPDTICEVVFDDYAFSFTHDGLTDDMYTFTAPKDVRAVIIAFIVAREAIRTQHYVEVGNTHYHTQEVNPSWSTHENFTVTDTIADHIFYSCVKYC